MKDVDELRFKRDFDSLISNELLGREFITFAKIILNFINIAIGESVIKNMRMQNPKAVHQILWIYAGEFLIQ